MSLFHKIFGVKHVEKKPVVVDQLDGMQMQLQRVDEELEHRKLDPVEDPLDEKPGLEVKFMAGEQIPWKGIWFRIEKVAKAQLTLVPESMTFKMAKKVEEAQHARR